MIMSKKFENEFLRQKFRMQRYETVCEFKKFARSVLSEETWTSVLHRDTAPSLKTLLIMAIELGSTREEIVILLEGRKEHTIAKFIAGK
jgi:hypothetical protein